ncbi:MAG: hypothetical protein PVH82_09190 [Desulfobacteraceae bacterium]
MTEDPSASSGQAVVSLGLECVRNCLLKEMAVTVSNFCKVKAHTRDKTSAYSDIEI